MGAPPHLQGLLVKSSSHPLAAPQTSRVDLGSLGTRTAASVKPGPEHWERKRRKAFLPSETSGLLRRLHVI